MLTNQKQEQYHTNSKITSYQQTKRISVSLILTNLLYIYDKNLYKTAVMDAQPHSPKKQQFHKSLFL